MEESVQKPTYFPPMRLSEMMPHLFGTLPHTGKFMKTARRTESTSTAGPHTTGKGSAPIPVLTVAQLCAALKTNQPFSRSRAPPSSMKKKWNTSTKCENKRISHTANANSKQFTARKILNFQPAPKPALSNIPRPSSKRTFVTPKHIKAETEMKKGIQNHQNKKNFRISGISNILETPVQSGLAGSCKIVRDNKENNPGRVTVGPASFVKPQGVLDDSIRQLNCNKRQKSVLQGTNLNTKTTFENHSKNTTDNTITEECSQAVAWIYKEINEKGHANATNLKEKFRKNLYLHGNKALSPVEPSPTDSVANSERSFLKQEKEIYDETAKEPPAFIDSPHISTPFKQYRNVSDCFNESSELENSLLNNTAVHLDKASFVKANGSTEESDILSLCDLMDRAKMSHIEKTTQEYEIELINIKGQLEEECSFLKQQRRYVIMAIKRNEIMLKSVNKLLQPSRPYGVTPNKTKKSDTNLKSCRETSEILVTHDNTITLNSGNSIRRFSTSPSYKIPKHNPCLRKKLLYKSVPLDIDKINPTTPTGRAPPVDKAMTMYMKMKEQCHFLVTPVMNRTLNVGKVTNTPAITSYNLQSQLEKLYNETP